MPIHHPFIRLFLDSFSRIFCVESNTSSDWLKDLVQPTWSCITFKRSSQCFQKTCSGDVKESVLFLGGKG